MCPLFPAIPATLLLAAAVTLAAQPLHTQTPRQVADTLDGIVQPRFQQNAGRFGVDRVMVGGHDGVYDLDIHTPRERTLLRQAKSAHRPFVIGFLHCVHKPGRDIGAKHAEDLGKDFQPFTEVLAAVAVSQASTDRLYNWGENHLQAMSVPCLPLLRKGETVEAENGNWVVVMRPVRASQALCLGCHAGAKTGDTLGVMLYAVDKNVMPSPLNNVQVGLQ